MTPSVRIIRVLGIRSRDPSVLAGVDRSLVRWTPRDGWTCDCDAVGSCDHVDTIAGLLDPRVIGG